MTVTKNKCGSCSACCKVMAVSDIAKPYQEQCPHCVHPSFVYMKPVLMSLPVIDTPGCGIYEQRPELCRDFQCAWLAGELGDDEAWRPDRLGIVFHSLTGSIFGDMITAHEVWRGAIREGDGRLLMNCLSRNSMIMCFSFNDRWLVGPPDKLQEAFELLTDSQNAGVGVEIIITGNEDDE